MCITLISALGTPTVTNILGVRQLLAIPLSEDSSQFGSILELSHSSKMEVLFWRDWLSSQINNLEGNHNIIHIVHTIQVDVLETFRPHMGSGSLLL